VLNKPEKLKITIKPQGYDTSVPLIREIERTTKNHIKTIRKTKNKNPLVY